MNEVRNPNNKRVFDVSDDQKTIELRVKGCLTIISAEKDGRLKWKHKTEEA